MSQRKQNIKVIEKSPSREAMKRIIKDICEIKKSDLHDHGIYYVHDDENILKGYAMIIGPTETRYDCGHYIFELDFPEDYPHAPIRMKYMSNYNGVRFHPNMYRDGKVCLSILNTWAGEQWSACQSIKSVLLVIQSILDKEPLLHEPGVTKFNINFNKYHEIIDLTNIKHCYLEPVEYCLFSSSKTKKSVQKLNTPLKKYYDLFRENILENYEKNHDKVIKNIEKYSNYEIYESSLSIYNMSCIVDVKKLRKTLKKLSFSNNKQ